MKRTTILAAAGIAMLGLAACVEETTTVTTIRSGSPADESACLNAVARQTGNSVTVLESTFSEANTEVIVGVGPELARWRCLSSGGVVAEVMSLTNEGTL